MATCGSCGRSTGVANDSRCAYSPASEAFGSPPLLDCIPLHSPLYGGVQREGRVEPLLFFALSVSLLSLTSVHRARSRLSAQGPSGGDVRLVREEDWRGQRFEVCVEPCEGGGTGL